MKSISNQTKIATHNIQDVSVFFKTVFWENNMKKNYFLFWTNFVNINCQDLVHIHCRATFKASPIYKFLISIIVVNINELTRLFLNYFEGQDYSSPPCLKKRKKFEPPETNIFLKHATVEFYFPVVLVDVFYW